MGKLFNAAVKGKKIVTNLAIIKNREKGIFYPWAHCGGGKCFFKCFQRDKIRKQSQGYGEIPGKTKGKDY